MRIFKGMMYVTVILYLYVIRDDHNYPIPGKFLRGLICTVFCGLVPIYTIY